MSVLNQTTIIVSRFNEDIEWIEVLKEKHNVIIFNKGSLLDNTISLENVGREAHTYVQYIIDNYNNLPEVVLFIQGNPFDHNITSQSFDQLINEAKIFGMSQNKALHNVGIFNAVSNFNIFVHCGKQVFPYKVNEKVLNFGEWFTHVTGMSFPQKPIEWYIGACFAARKDMIQNVSIEIWRNILESLSYSIAPTTAHFMERSWYLLMSKDL